MIQYLPVIQAKSVHLEYRFRRFRSSKEDFGVSSGEVGTGKRSLGLGPLLPGQVKRYLDLSFQAISGMNGHRDESSTKRTSLGSDASFIGIECLPFKHLTVCVKHETMFRFSWR
jgi:hypothetical protein